MHPDFFLLRRILPPLAKGDRFAEEWTFIPLGLLDGPVKSSIPRPGGQSFEHSFGEKAVSLEPEHFSIERDQAELESPDRARFSYPMVDATSPFQKEFGFDPVSASDGK